MSDGWGRIELRLHNEAGLAEARERFFVASMREQTLRHDKVALTTSARAEQLEKIGKAAAMTGHWYRRVVEILAAREVTIAAGNVPLAPLVGDHIRVDDNLAAEQWHGTYVVREVTWRHGCYTAVLAVDRIRTGGEDDEQSE